MGPCIYCGGPLGSCRCIGEGGHKKLTHPCKDTCSGYSQDCVEQIEQLQARVKGLEKLNQTMLKSLDYTKEENARLQAVVDAAREWEASKDCMESCGKLQQAVREFKTAACVVEVNSKGV